MKVVLRSPSLLFFLVGVLLDLPVTKVKSRLEEEATPAKDSEQIPPAPEQYGSQQ